MIDSKGEIIDHELHSPFAYLRSLVDGFSTENPEECGSEQPLGGALKQSHLEPYSIPVEHFLAMLRFENRSKLAKLPGEFVKGGSR